MLHYLSHEVNTGFLSPENEKILGVYTFWEGLKMRGIGSSKVRYISGLSGFDIVQNNGTDLAQVNFELAKNALLIRIWFQGDCFIAYVFWKDINTVNFTPNNEFEILLKDEQKLLFKIDKGLKKSIIRFFEKSPILD